MSRPANRRVVGPLFCLKGNTDMTEERRLIAIGFPADDAICMCHVMRREGTLAEFVKREEEKYRERCREHVKEVID